MADYRRVFAQPGESFTNAVLHPAAVRFACPELVRAADGDCFDFDPRALRQSCHRER